MDHAEMKNAPSLAAWVIGGAAGVVAFGVALVVGHLGGNASVAIGIVIAAIAGFLLGGLGQSSTPPLRMRAAEPVAAMRSAEPVAPTIAAPAMSASFMSAPVSAAPAAPVAAPVSLMGSTDAPRRPEALGGPRGGKADQLQLIEGIGPKLEELCHSLGFYHFDQIANWTADEIGWVDTNLAGFKGRVTRDKWVAQAKLILAVGQEEFLRRAKTNDY